MDCWWKKNIGRIYDKVKESGIVDKKNKESGIFKIYIWVFRMNVINFFLIKENECCWIN